MLDRISNVVLGLDGIGHAERFADYSQWDQWQAQQKQALVKGSGASARAGAAGQPANAEPDAASNVGKKKLSYMDARDYATIESRIAAGEELLTEKRAQLELREVVTDAVRLQAALAALETAQNAVDALYARWAELEAKQYEVG
jgi:ABC transport system ATP-binding/permease protein